MLFRSSKSLFPQSCVSSGGSVVGLMVTSSKRAYAIAMEFDKLREMVKDREARHAAVHGVAKSRT